MVLVCFCRATHCISQEFESGAPFVPKRWALVCSKELNEQGVGDLVFAQLSKSNFELVERDLIDEVTRELELSAFDSADSTAQRLKLGSLLNADVLVLMSTEEVQSLDELRIVICDCRYGSRLAQSQLVIGNKNASELADVCFKSVTQTKARFANGLSAIIGVAPIQSRNLTHEFDRYQKGFQYLVQSALLSYPGVAVVEIEEVQAIRKELTLTGKDRVDPTVFVLLDGEFRVAPPKNNGPQLFQFELSITRTGDRAKLLKKTTTKGEAIEFLSTSLPEELLRGLKVGGGDQSAKFSDSTRMDWLIDQADSFSRRGNFDESIGLREATLLIDRKASGQRRKLIVENLQVFDQACPEFTELVDRPAENEKVQAITAPRISAYLSYLSHLKFLIRNRLISTNETVLLARNWDRPQIIPLPRELKTLLKETLDPAELNFFRDVTPLVFDLKRDFSFKIKTGNFNGFPMNSEFHLKRRWYDVLFQAYVKKRTAPDPNQVAELLTEVMKDDALTGPAVIGFFNTRSSNNGFNWGTLTQKLNESEHESCKWLGKYAQLRLRLNTYTESSSQNGESAAAADRRRRLRSELDLFASEYDQFLAKKQATRVERALDPLLVSLKIERVTLVDRDPGSPPPIVIGYSASGPIVDRPRTRPPPTRPATSKIAGVVRESRLQFDLKTLDGKTAPFINPGWPVRLEDRDFYIRNYHLDLVPCGNVDVWWGPGVILVMRQKGLLETAVVDRDANFSDVAWDGQNILIASRRDGLGVLDSRDLTYSVVCGQAQGLPPSELANQIAAVRPGVVFAVGAFGKNSRAWCATITLQNSAWVPRVFHEATEIDAAGNPDWEGTEMAFKPQWIAEVRSVDSDVRSYLVGRRPPGTRVLDFPKHKPLLVQPELGSVEVLNNKEAKSGQFRFSLRASNFSFYSLSGQLFICERSAVQYWKYDPVKKVLVPVRRLCEINKGIKWTLENSRNTHATTTRILEFDGHLLIPGLQWIKLDPKTLVETRFVSPVPDAILKPQTGYQNSTHYGLIGWKAYRVNGNRERTEFSQFKLEETDRSK